MHRKLLFTGWLGVSVLERMGKYSVHRKLLCTGRHGVLECLVPSGSKSIFGQALCRSKERNKGGGRREGGEGGGRRGGGGREGRGGGWEGGRGGGEDGRAGT